MEGKALGTARKRSKTSRRWTQWPKLPRCYIKTKKPSIHQRGPVNCMGYSFKSNIKRRFFSGLEGDWSMGVRVQQTLLCEQEGDDRHCRVGFGENGRIDHNHRGCHDPVCRIAVTQKSQNRLHKSFRPHSWDDGICQLKKSFFGKLWWPLRSHLGLPFTLANPGPPSLWSISNSSNFPIAFMTPCADFPHWLDLREGWEGIWSAQHYIPEASQRSWYLSAIR